MLLPKPDTDDYMTTSSVPGSPFLSLKHGGHDKIESGAELALCGLSPINSQSMEAISN